VQDLVETIARETGLLPAKAEQALGIMFNLLRNEGDRGKVEALFAKLPGAAELAAREGGDGAAKGGLLGLLGGGLMGGPLAAISKLSAAGLSTDQIKQVGTLTLAHAKAKAGPDLVREVAGSIPGLSGFV